MVPNTESMSFPAPLTTLRPTKSLGYNDDGSMAFQTPGSYAEGKLDFAETHSQLPRKSIRTINWKDLRLREKLGSGAFCDAHMAQVQQYSDGTKPNKQALAVKVLGTNALHHRNSCHLKMAAADLVLEGAVLSKLDHPNIIKLHGVSSSPISNAFEQSNRYFLALDLLECTLTDRLKGWRSSNSSMHRRTLMPPAFASQTSRRAVLQRVEQVALGVAMGMDYLHSRNVVIRDLKPCNVGFDHSGNVKLFDFGFARELHTCPKEIAGSLRYMAPEVSKGNVSLKVDVYSFGVLLWELCTLKKPYAPYKDTKTFKEKVFDQRCRPQLRGIPSGTLKRLIASCWDECPEVRPDFAQIVRTLITLLQRENPEFQVPKHASFQGRGRSVERATRRRMRLRSPIRATSTHTRSTPLRKMLSGMVFKDTSREPNVAESEEMLSRSF